MPPRKTFKLPFYPRPWQAPLLDDRAPRIVAVVHRRAGKSTALMWRGIRRCLVKTTAQIEAEKEAQATGTERGPTRVVHILPYGVMWARTGLWDALTSATRNIPGTEVRKASMSILFPGGAVFQCGGADNPDAWRGGYADECTIDEFDDTPASMVPLVIEAMLADRGGVLVRSGTPKGRGLLQAAYDRARTTAGYSSYLLDYTKTDALSDEAIETLRREMSEEEFAQELMCSFNTPNSGSYYGKLMDEAEREGRITGVPHDPGLKVWTAWDLGVDDSTAIWCCQVSRGGEWRMIDYIEDSGAGLDHYVRLLQQRPYVYERHLLPHDAEVRELGSGRTRTETLHGLGVKPTRVVRQHSVADGIQAVRAVLPRCWFDAERCAKGIKALRHYRREWNEAAQTWRASPVHDHASHGCLTGDTLVLTNQGERRIDQIREGDRVWTPAGYAEVLAAGPTKLASELMLITLADGRALHCTPEHKIATTRGFVRADALRYLDTVLSGNEWTSRLIGSYSRVASTGFRATITDAINGASQGRLIFTGRYGKVLTGLSQRVVRSITATAIHLTTPWKTLSASTPGNISVSTAMRSMPPARYILPANWRESEPQNGTPARKASSGTASMGGASWRSDRGLFSIANSAVRLLLRLRLSKQSGVISIARWKTCDSGVESRLVYDLTVKNHACYQANGLLVSNSDSMRYLALGVREAEAKSVDSIIERQFPTTRTIYENSHNTGWMGV